ncbi:RING-type E3 ubiquitin transferase [Ranunculus cassubicifolius]
MNFKAYIFGSSLASFHASIYKFRQLTFKTVLGNLISAVLSLLFAIVGTLFGVITGAMLGKKLDFGIVRGGIIGAVLGALSSADVFISFRRLWQIDDKGSQSFHYLVHVLVSLVNGRLVQERFDLIIFNAEQTQIEAEEILGLFDIGGCKGLSVDTVNKIPMIAITGMNQADSYGEIIPCAVCLQDFQLGEKVRKLYYCQHMFHPTCIDQWLTQHGSCPLCRRQL